MNPFQSLSDYEAFIYQLGSRFAAIRRSTLVVVRRGATVAVLRGELEFDHGIRLNLRERLTFDHSPGSIREYGYEVRQHGELRYWYDSQPHPDDATLAATHPHHRHVHPDIKHHRIPAPGLSFQQPNIPVPGIPIEQVNDERIVYRLPKPQRDGRTALSLSPLELIDHLVAQPENRVAPALVSTAIATMGCRQPLPRCAWPPPPALVIVPATGGRGFSRSGAQAPLIFFEISGIATG